LGYISSRRKPSQKEEEEKEEEEEEEEEKQQGLIERTWARFILTENEEKSLASTC
jgi:hypothetical protein